MSNQRALLEQYVRSGKLMQLASLNSDGSPAVCNVWYDAHFAPAAFVARWPRAEAAINPSKLARGEIATRVYEVMIAEWVLFDEENFPEQPRQVVTAVR